MRSSALYKDGMGIYKSVLFRLHREMLRALSLLPRRTQQLKNKSEKREKTRIKNRKEVREGGEYAKERERVVFSKE